MLLPLAASVGGFVQGLVLGIGAAAPPGPVNLEITRRVARGGFVAGAAVGLGAVTVDVVLATLLVVGLLEVAQEFWFVRVPLQVVGILLLTRLGVGGLLAFRRGRTEDEPPVTATPGGGYLTGVLLCATSPYQAAFWLTGVFAILSSTGGGWPVIAGVFIATLAWVVGFSGSVHLLASGGRGQWLAPATDLLGGIILLGFAAAVAWSLAKSAL